MPGAFSPMIDGVTARPTEYGLVRKSRAGKCADAHRQSPPPRILANAATSTQSRNQPAFWRICYINPESQPTRILANLLHQPRVATNPHSGECAYTKPESQPTRILANAATPNQSRNQPAFSRMRLHQTRVATNPHSRECGYRCGLGHRISVTARHPTETKEHEA